MNGPMRRRDKRPGPATTAARYAQRLTEEALTQHVRHAARLGALSGPLTGNVPELLRYIVDLYFHVSLGRICFDLTTCCDYPMNEEKAPATAILMSRVGVDGVIDLAWSRHRVVVGGVAIRYTAPDAAEALLAVLADQVSAFIFGEQG